MTEDEAEKIRAAEIKAETIRCEKILAEIEAEIIHRCSEFITASIESQILGDAGFRYFFSPEIGEFKAKDGEAITKDGQRFPFPPTPQCSYRYVSSASVADNWHKKDV